MKKFLAFALAIAMMASLSVAGMATETSPAQHTIQVEEKDPGQTVDMDTLSANLEYGARLSYTSDEPVASVRFEDGVFKGTLLPGNQIGVQFNDPDYKDDSQFPYRPNPSTSSGMVPLTSRNNADTMILTLENGQECRFPVTAEYADFAIKINAVQMENIVFENATFILWDCMMESASTATITLGIQDVLEISEAPYTFTARNSSGGANFEIGEIVPIENGTKARLTVTHTGKPTDVDSCSMILEATDSTEGKKGSCLKPFINLTISTGEDVLPDIPEPDIPIYDPNPKPDPDKPNPDNPNPDNPDPEEPGPNTPPADDESDSRGGGSEPSATENTINTEETIQAIAYGDEMLELKVTNGSAGIGLTTMDTLGNYHTTVSVQNGSMRVEIPGGFGKVTEPGRIYYPMDFSDNLANAAELAAAVKGDNAKTEVVKAGGDMVMPTTVTVTLKTKLTGAVRVYYYNEETRRYTLLASPVAKDGKVTFATKQMGHLVLTTGTI